MAAEGGELVGYSALDRLETQSLSLIIAWSKPTQICDRPLANRLAGYRDSLDIDTANDCLGCARYPRRMRWDLRF